VIIKAAIGVGSNQGNRPALLKQAREMLESIWSCPMRRSSIYETEAWGMTEGTPAFLNQVLLFEWEKMPRAEDLLEDLLHIELELGRRRRSSSNQGYQSRTIDLDLLFLGEHVQSSDRLELPHPRMTSRKFVLEPLNELCPDFILQPWDQSIEELLNACSDEMPVRLYLSDSKE
jgi:2-amino-4-hydroxy-6-hydroxymethyldihydropteridine diphosphokinase